MGIRTPAGPEAGRTVAVMPARGERRRAYRGFTHEPYECCGKDPGPRGRPKRTICRECGQLIEDGKALRQQTSQQVASGDRGLYRFHERDYAVPGYYSPGLSSDHQRTLQAALFGLVQAAAMPAPVTAPPYANSGQREEDDWEPEAWPHVLTVKQDRHDWGSLVLLPPAVRDAIDRFDQAIRAALASTYQAGKKDGRSVLLGLATGEVSLADFDEALLTGQELAERRRARRGY